MLDIVIFSNDRGCQLDLLLRSIKRFFSEWREANIKVLYTASSRRFDRAYNEVRAEHPEFRYVCEQDHESSLRELTIGLVREGSNLMSLVDGDVFTEPFSLCERALAEHALSRRHAICSAEWLNDQYLAGRRLSLEPVTGVVWDEPAPEAGGGERPLVSVVIPCFNCAPYLAQTIDSVLEQTLGGIEVIIVDDGSTDDSVRVARRLIEEHPEASFRLLEQRNSGHPGYTRNAGVFRARAEYVLCLDADDLLTASFLSMCVATLDAHPEAGFAYADQYFFGAANSWVSVIEYDFHTLTRRNIVGGMAAVFRRSVWEEVGWFDPHRRFEDWHFWIACGALGRHGVKAHGTDWCYRVRGDGRYRTGGAPRDRLNKAQLVARWSELYTEAQREWAAAVLAGDPLADTVADEQGLVPQLEAFPLPAPRPVGKRAGAPDASALNSFVTVACAVEVVADPALLTAYAESFGADDDATLVLYAPDGGDGDLVERLVETIAAVGMDGTDGPAMIALNVPRTEGDDALLRRAHAVLSDGPGPPGLTSLPWFGVGSVGSLRAWATEVWGCRAA
jgi:glycosyl transferase family 2